MGKAEILARNIIKSGYGVGFDRIFEILSKLTDKEIDDLTYVLHRTCEKVGLDAFDCDDIVEW